MSSCSFFSLSFYIKISFPCCLLLPQKRNVDKQFEMIHICSCAISYSFDKVAFHKSKKRNKKLKCGVNQNPWPGCVLHIYKHVFPKVFSGVFHIVSVFNNFSKRANLSSIRNQSMSLFVWYFKKENIKYFSTNSRNTQCFCDWPIGFWLRFQYLGHFSFL